MNNLIDIQSQINSLQKQAAEIKARDFDSTVKEIQSLMQLFGITLKNIEAPPRKLKKTNEGAAVKKVKAVSVAAKKAVEQKYCGPEGQTWTGRGLSPKWLATLIAQGSKREDFLITKGSSAAPATPEVLETPAVPAVPEVSTGL